MVDAANRLASFLQAHGFTCEVHCEDMYEDDDADGGGDFLGTEAFVKVGTVTIDAWCVDNDVFFSCEGFARDTQSFDDVLKMVR